MKAIQLIGHGGFEKLVFKNAKLLTQENVIEKLEDEQKRLEEINQGHKKLNGELMQEIKQLKQEE